MESYKTLKLAFTQPYTCKSCITCAHILQVLEQNIQINW